MVSVELLFDPDCPNVETARAELRRALERGAAQPHWREWRIGDPEAPAHTRGYGSPTILIDGCDVAGGKPDGGRAYCRLYSDSAGSLRGAPSLEQILGALDADDARNQATPLSYCGVDEGSLEPGSDEALMAAYQAGDMKAFETLFHRYQDRLYGYFVRRFGDRELAADLFQRTFLRIHRGRTRYDASRSFATWAFGIASNLGKDELKRRARRPGDVTWDGPDDDKSAGPDPEAQLLATERTRTIETALAELADSQREVILLHKVEGLSFPQIAEALGEQVEAVKSRAFRGYRTLRRHLGPNEEHPQPNEPAVVVSVEYRRDLPA